MGNLTVIEFEREDLTIRPPWPRYPHIRVSQYSLVVAVVVEHSSTRSIGSHDEYEVYRIRFEVERNGR